MRQVTGIAPKGFIAGEDWTAEGCPRSFSSIYMDLYLFYYFYSGRESLLTRWTYGSNFKWEHEF